MSADSEDRVVEAIYDALDAGEAETAEALAREALARQDEDDPVLRLLHGVALLDLDRPSDAESSLRRSVDLDPDDAEARANLALALFRTCRFAEAAHEAARALQTDPDLPDAHVVLALVAERSGKFAECNDSLQRAADLDPERFPEPIRFSRAEFEAEVLRAGERLPETFRRHLESVALTVEDLPSSELLFDGDPPLDPELLGLFVGTPITQRVTFASIGELPSRILLFQRNLERHAIDREDLLDEITITVYHELGHYLGLDEGDLEELNLA